METLNYTPIGTFRCQNLYKYEAPRQSIEDSSGDLGEVRLFSGQTNFKQALKGLEGFERIWLLFEFNQNQNWKPLTRTPRDSEKQGVFATRSPYRPNPIGMSCVKLVEVKGLKIFVKEFDLLDGTPILDIKPYVPHADSFDVRNQSWLEEETFKKVEFSPLSLKQIDWIESHKEGQIQAFVVDQLKRDPLNRTKKRVRQIEGHLYELCFRTWRVEFIHCNDISKVERIKTGYSEKDFLNPSDKHNNKYIHQSFMKTFYNQ